MGKLLITWVKSSIGYNKRQKDTIRSLGLKRLNHSVLQPDSPVIRGMAKAVQHLVKVEEVTE